jgi:hypothetical protein
MPDALVRLHVHESKTRPFVLPDVAVVQLAVPAEADEVAFMQEHAVPPGEGPGS